MRRQKSKGAYRQRGTELWGSVERVILMRQVIDAFCDIGVAKVMVFLCNVLEWARSQGSFNTNGGVYDVPVSCLLPR